MQAEEERVLALEARKERRKKTRLSGVVRLSRSPQPQTSLLWLLCRLQAEKEHVLAIEARKERRETGEIEELRERLQVATRVVRTKHCCLWLLCRLQAEKERVLAL
jgi:hypothetical protein